ncbi:TPA: hypothetical protein QDC22_006714 [Burkholderia stabilis]|uniref:Uncharacterized protein n=1 Tax=Burkholderia stabilis TaxID=95485 RepID=A0AAJ5NES7_9BURK|nr:hypothetical protein [Burkholderia stabilis]VBB16941.1 hypothetical protein BSTAB16_7148 [Burkholderia stabilis]HDR9588569.1 hypothetical protein [Burkholderia stabilis]HDR9652807.1 hypothetical protein [Burkholderia stabilis]HDR9683130.1 hypothetical protein [Burkholderia stabilis]
MFAMCRFERTHDWKRTMTRGRSCMRCCRKDRTARLDASLPDFATDALALYARAIVGSIPRGRASLH